MIVEKTMEDVACLEGVLNRLGYTLAQFQEFVAGSPTMPRWRNESLVIAIQDFLDHLKVHRNHADTTLQQYGYDLMFFARWLAKAENNDDDKVKALTTGDIKPTDVADCLHDMSARFQQHKNRPISSSKYNRTLAVLNGFVKFCKREGHLPKDFEHDAQKRPNDRPVPRAPSQGDLRKILFEAANSRYPFCVLTAIALGMFCGLRISEVADLSISAFDFARNLVTVEGKGGKVRTIPLGLATPFVRAYLLMRGPCLGPNDQDALLLANEGRNRGKRLKTPSIRSMVKTVFRRAGVDYKAGRQSPSFHHLRHAFAQGLLDEGASIEDVRYALGHESVSSTQIYTMMHPDKVISRLIKFSPFLTERILTVFRELYAEQSAID